MNRRKNLIGTIAIGAALLTVPVAQAQSADDRPGPHGAVGIISAAPVVRPDDRAGPRGATAVVSVSRRPDDRAGVRGPGSAPVSIVPTATSDGFDWVDALIGGVGGVAMALLVLGGSFLLLSQRKRTRTA